jgi:hypothetical protein
LLAASRLDEWTGLTESVAKSSQKSRKEPNEESTQLLKESGLERMLGSPGGAKGSQFSSSAFPVARPADEPVDTRRPAMDLADTKTAKKVKLAKQTHRLMNLVL